MSILLSFAFYLEIIRSNLHHNPTYEGANKKIKNVDCCVIIWKKMAFQSDIQCGLLQFKTLN